MYPKEQLAIEIKDLHRLLLSIKIEKCKSDTGICRYFTVQLRNTSEKRNVYLLNC